jgi:hypothetical protein
VLPGDELAVARHRFKVDYNVAPDAPPPPPLNDEEDLGTSLLEKAGLMRRRSPARPPAKPPGAAPLTNGNSSHPATDDDRAVEWLNGDDDDE